MVDTTDNKLSISQQCNILHIHRSGLYYKPGEVNEIDLKIMKEIDTLHMKDPTLGTRRMRAMLIRLDYNIGRRHVRTLMQRCA